MILRTHPGWEGIPICKVYLLLELFFIGTQDIKDYVFNVLYYAMASEVCIAAVFVLASHILQSLVGFFCAMSAILEKSLFPDLFSRFFKKICIIGCTHP